MANVNRVNGFKPVKYLNGAPWNGQANLYYVVAGDATALFIGDLVTFDGSGDAATLIPSVSQAAAGEDIVGAVVGFKTTSDGMSNGRSPNLDTPIYRPASTAAWVYVSDDPNILYEAQEDGDTDPLEAADLGLNVNFVVGAGNTVTGASGMQIDSTTHSTVNTLPLRLVAAVQRPDNEIVSGGQAYTRWLVKINAHQFNSDTGVTGI